MDTASFPQLPISMEKRPSSRQLERIREQRLRIAGYAGLVVFLLAIALVAVALMVEPAGTDPNVAVLAPPAIAPTPSLPLAESATVVNDATTTVATPTLETAPTAEAAIPEVAIPPALQRIVDERMATADRERFLSDWAAMSPADRVEYLRQLGYEVTIR